MGQRLDDDPFLVDENDVSITEHLHVQGSLSVFGVKRERKHPVKAHLFDSGQSGIAQVFSEDHGKRGWRHRHGAVPL